MSTTGARYGAKIDSTVDRQAPYAWTLGDGSTIAGLELAIICDQSAGVPPMLPGGVRRVIIPSKLAYEDLAKPNKNGLQFQDCSTGRGPIPPNTPQKSSDMGAGEFQRFKNICKDARAHAHMHMRMHMPRQIRAHALRNHLSLPALDPFFRRCLLSFLSRAHVDPSKIATQIGPTSQIWLWTSSYLASRLDKWRVKAAALLTCCG